MTAYSCQFDSTSSGTVTAQDGDGKLGVRGVIWLGITEADNDACSDLAGTRCWTINAQSVAGSRRNIDYLPVMEG